MNSPEYSPRVPDPAGEAVDSGRGRIFPCQKCGSDLTFHIGQQMLDCRHCGHRQAIGFPSDASAVVEHDYVKSVTMQASQKRALVDAPQEHNEVRCESCGAHVLFEGTLTSTSCPYCGSPIQRENIHRGGFRIPVDGVLAFQIEQGIARTRLKAWISSRWFAPNDFKKAATDDHFQGVYLPFWTFDSLTSTRFSGERAQTCFENPLDGGFRSVSAFL
jgi:DNA-directed RNA polymerase subunit RPC12/RpoP